jgi:hypothetical protein
MNKKFILCLVLAILSCALFVSAQEPVDDGTTTDDSQDDLRLFFYLKLKLVFFHKVKLLLIQQF